MRVGIIGLGIMGSALAERLLADGLPVGVFNRTPSKAESLLEKGAIWTETPESLASRSEILITTLTDDAAVSEVSNGIRDSLLPDSVHCEVSTIGPDTARAIAESYAESGMRYVQAPVLGSRRQIEESTLLVFAGGDDEDADRCEEIWKRFSRRTWRFQRAEQAATVKLACNMMIAQMIIALGQSLVFTRESGIPPQTLLEILAESPLGAPMYAGKGKTLLESDYRANFTIRNAIKDLSLAQEAGKQVGLDLKPNLGAMHHFKNAESAGFGDQDYSAVAKMLGWPINEPASG